MVLINDTNEPTQQEEEKPTFEDFEEHFGKNPELSNIEIYEKFQQIPKSTLRYWKKKVVDKIKATITPTTVEETPTDKPTEDDPYMKGQLEAWEAMIKDPQLLVLSKDMDFKSKYMLYKNAFDNRKSDPNLHIIPTPVSSGQSKIGIDKYLVIDKVGGEITMTLPASVAFDPEKNKELREFK